MVYSRYQKHRGHVSWSEKFCHENFCAIHLHDSHCQLLSLLLEMCALLEDYADCPFVATHCYSPNNSPDLGEHEWNCWKAVDYCWLTSCIHLLGGWAVPRLDGILKSAHVAIDYCALWKHERRARIRRYSRKRSRMRGDSERKTESRSKVVRLAWMLICYPYLKISLKRGLLNDDEHWHSSPRSTEIARLIDMQNCIEKYCSAEY